MTLISTATTTQNNNKKYARKQKFISPVGIENKHTHSLKILMWKIPGSIKASNVQHVAPTRAMSVVKFGIATTITPDNKTIPDLRIFWNDKMRNNIK